MDETASAKDLLGDAADTVSDAIPDAAGDAAARVSDAIPDAARNAGPPRPPRRTSATQRAARGVSHHAGRAAQASCCSSSWGALIGWLWSRS